MKSSNINAVTGATLHNTAPAFAVAADAPPRARSLTDTGQSLWLHTVALLWPWKRFAYGGWSIQSAETLGYAKATVRRWKSRGGSGVSSDAAARIAAHLETHATMAATLAAEWRRYGAERASIEAARVPFFRKRAAGWRASPRL